MKFIITTVVLALCFTSIGGLFWNQELQYVQPTPVPGNYKAVTVATHVELPASFTTDRAVYLHFFNPDCPCSRFNLKHFISLVNTFQEDVAIYAVIPATSDGERARALVPANIPVLEDRGDQIASACGVYATPQAVIIDKNRILYYRGNYNKSRYCTMKDTNYAEQALTALVNNRPAPAFDAFATQAYGCSLPSNTFQ